MSFNRFFSYITKKNRTPDDDAEFLENAIISTKKMIHKLHHDLRVFSFVNGCMTKNIMQKNLLFEEILKIRKQAQYYEQCLTSLYKIKNHRPITEKERLNLLENPDFQNTFIENYKGIAYCAIV